MLCQGGGGFFEWRMESGQMGGSVRGLEGLVGTTELANSGRARPRYSGGTPKC